MTSRIAMGPVGRLPLGRWELRLPLGFAVAAVAGVVLFTGLGRWQWHRAAEKRALADDFAAGAHHIEPLGDRPLAQFQRYAQLQVQGQYDGAHQFLLDNLSHDGQAGYQVLTPLRLADGRVLLVNRGWLPMGTDRRVLPSVQLDDSQPVTLTGQLDALPRAALAMGHAAPADSGSWPRLTSFPQQAELSHALGHSVEQGQLLLGASQPQGYLRDWHPYNSGFGPERNLSYAIQWWGLAALSGGLFFFMNFRRRT